MAVDRLDIIINAVDHATAKIQHLNNNMVRYLQGMTVQNRHLRTAVQQTNATLQQQSAILQRTANQQSQYMRNMSVQLSHVIQRLNTLIANTRHYTTQTQTAATATRTATTATQSWVGALANLSGNLVRVIDNYRHLLLRITVGVVVFRSTTMAIGGFINAIKSGIQEVENYERAILSMTSAFVSMDRRTTSANISQMFQQTEEYVRALLNSLRLLDVEFSGSLEDLIAITREFAVYGVVIDTNNRRHLEGLRGVAEAIKALSPHMDTAREAAQLVRAAVYGIRGEMDNVTRALRLSGEEGKKFRAEMNAAKTPAERMNIIWEALADRTKGFIEAGERMRFTLEASVTSLETVWTIISQEGFKQVWKDIVLTLQEWRSLLMDNNGQLTEMGQRLADEINVQWERIKQALRDAFGGTELPDFIALVRTAGDILVSIIRTINTITKTFMEFKRTWDALPGFIKQLATIAVIARFLLGLDIVSMFIRLGRFVGRLLPYLDKLTTAFWGLRLATLGWYGALILIGAGTVLWAIRTIARNIERLQMGLPPGVFPDQALQSVRTPMLRLQIQGERPGLAGLTVPRLEYERPWLEPPPFGQPIPSLIPSKPKKPPFTPQPTPRAPDDKQQGREGRDPAIDRLRDFLALKQRQRELNEITAEEELQQLRTTGMALANKIKDVREKELALHNVRVRMQRVEQEMYESRIRINQEREEATKQHAQEVERLTEDLERMVEQAETEYDVSRIQQYLAAAEAAGTITKEVADAWLAKVRAVVELRQEIRQAEIDFENQRRQDEQAEIEIQQKNEQRRKDADAQLELLRAEIDLQEALDAIRREGIIGERQRYEADLRARQRVIENLQRQLDLMEKANEEAAKMPGGVLVYSPREIQEITDKIRIAKEEANAFQEAFRIRTDPVAAWAAVIEQIRGYVHNWYETFLRVTDAIEGAFQQLFTDILSGSKEFGESLLDFFRGIVNAIIAELARLAARWVIGWLFPFAKGGIIPMAHGGMIPAYQYGAVVATGSRAGVYGEPTYLVGEGRNREAVVPLPDNRSIPVRFENGGAQQPLEVKIKVVQVFDPRNIPKPDPDEILAVVAADAMRGGPMAKVIKKVIGR
jgi:hypothetical protein